jgi:hypothetical protein
MHESTQICTVNSRRFAQCVQVSFNQSVLVNPLKAFDTSQMTHLKAFSFTFDFMMGLAVKPSICGTASGLPLASDG